VAPQFVLQVEPALRQRPWVDFTGLPISDTLTDLVVLAVNAAQVAVPEKDRP
jgi:hypothetical protein